MTSCPGISRFLVRYRVRRGRNKGKLRSYVYYKTRIGVLGRTIHLGNFRRKSEAIAKRRVALDRLAKGEPYSVIAIAR